MPLAGELHALGIDVGISGVRAAVTRADGTLAGTARRAHERAIRSPGVAEHDPQDWLDGMRETARRARDGAGSPPIGAVGIAALGPAPLLVDAGGAALTRAPLFSLDGRAHPQRARLDPDGGARVADHALPHLQRIVEEQPELRARAAWALDATGFLVSRCIGEPVMDTVTRADHVWPGAEPVAPLPVPLAPGVVAGRLDAPGAELLGLDVGVPVLAGTYDSFVDLAGAGVTAPGDAGLVLGSTMIVGVARTTAEPVAGLGVSDYPGDGVLLGGWTLSGGMVLEWGERTLAGEPEELRRAAAALAPGCGGILVLPYFAGERTPVWDLAARGAVIGLNLDVSAAELYRGLVDALALAVRDHVARLPGPPPARWRVTGGGVRNEPWLQATADAVGAPLDIVADAGEAVGPALLALAAIGAPVARAIERSVLPDSSDARRFDVLYDAYRGLHPLLAGAAAR